MKFAKLKRKSKPLVDIIVGAGRKYGKDDPIRLAGTTSFFTLFAVAPILIIIISVVGFLIGEEPIRQKIYLEINELIGEEGTSVIKNIVQNYQDTERNLIGSIIGIAIFLLAATTFFNVLQKSLNYIWRVRAKPKSNLLKSLRDRILSFGMIISLGFILLVSMIIDAILSFLRDYLEKYFPDVTLFLIEGANFLFSFAVITLIFVIIYKFLPDVKIKWKVTWIGALITAILFTLGKYLIGFGLANTNIGIMYGTAGSIVITLLWVFYSSLILFFGAEITQQYAEYYGNEILPKDYAVKIQITEIKEEK
ncbi:MAG: YihY/virulence factor BrkB family protein [Bacteroidota bacterium]